MFLLVLSSCATQNKKEEGKEGTSSAQSATDKKMASPKKAEMKDENRKVLRSIECRNGEDLRVVKNLQNPDGGCAVDYQKFGETTEVASARYQMTHCEEIFERIQGKLKESGFTCQ